MVFSRDLGDSRAVHATGPSRAHGSQAIQHRRDHLLSEGPIQRPIGIIQAIKIDYLGLRRFHMREWVGEVIAVGIAAGQRLSPGYSLARRSSTTSRRMDGLGFSKLFLKINAIVLRLV